MKIFSILFIIWIMKAHPIEFHMKFYFRSHMATYILYYMNELVMGFAILQNKNRTTADF